MAFILMFIGVILGCAAGALYTQGIDSWKEKH